MKELEKRAEIRQIILQRVQTHKPIVIALNNMLACFSGEVATGPLYIGFLRCLAACMQHARSKRARSAQLRKVLKRKEDIVEGNHRHGYDCAAAAGPTCAVLNCRTSETSQ